MTLTKSLTILIGSAFALTALPAMADTSPDRDVKTVDVYTSAYDLTQSEDARLLYKEIERAAKRACRDTSSIRSLSERADETQCRDEAIANAVAQLNEPVLTFVMNEEIPSS